MRKKLTSPMNSRRPIILGVLTLTTDMYDLIWNRCYNLHSIKNWLLFIFRLWQTIYNFLGCSWTFGKSFRKGVGIPDTPPPFQQSIAIPSIMWSIKKDRIDVHKAIMCQSNRHQMGLRIDLILQFGLWSAF